MLLLYLGLYDSIPIDRTLDILRKYLPIRTFKKIYKYITSNYSNSLSCISWTDVKNQLDKIDIFKCAQEFIDIFKDAELKDKNVIIFHLENNQQHNEIYEPTHSNTNNLIYRFLLYIYKRNILASIIKYILLHHIIYKLSTSRLTQDFKGIFSQMLKRLNEIVFESIITAFNGSNYDNYLIINHLVIILTKLKHQIHIFKKGASISSVNIKIKHNLPHVSNINKNGQIKKKSKKKNDFLMSLYIKDIRNLVASNLSLDKLGRLFSLPVSKGIFPYEQATSIKKLKNLNSLYPYDESFWHDSFTGKSITIDDRIKAQSIFDETNCKDLYEYSVYYLVKDCVLLHSIVYTLFHSFLKQSINICLRRNFSQSSLSFQEFFVTLPSRQIMQNIAPKKICHTFSNYFIKLGVTGGICTSFVHGEIDQNTVINDHFNFVEKPDLDKKMWPNFNNISSWSNNFNLKPSGISTIDIRSLYPSACLKKIPVGTPLLYNRFTHSDFKQLRTKGFAPILYTKGFYDNVQLHVNHQTDMIKLVNKPPRGKT